MKKQNIDLHHVEDIHVSSIAKKAVSETLQDSSDNTEEKRVSESEATESGNDQEQQKQKQNKRDQPRRRFGEDKGTDNVEKERTKKEQVVQRLQKEKTEGFTFTSRVCAMACDRYVAICIVCVFFLLNVVLCLMIIWYFTFMYKYH